MARILGPEAYLYKKDLGDVYRDIEAVKGARFARETGEAKQAGLMKAYGTEDAGEAYAKQASSQLFERSIKVADQADDIVREYVDSTGDVEGGKEMFRQMWEESDDLKRIYAEPPEYIKTEGERIYHKGALTMDITHPKTGEPIKAGTAGIFVYNKQDELLDILPVGEQYKPAAAKGTGKEGENMRKLVKDAYDFAFKGLKLNKEDTFLKLQEMDDTGEVQGLNPKQQKYIDDAVEDYIRRFGGDDQWKAFKQGKKRMKKQLPSEVDPRTAAELEEEGLVAPAGTKSKSSTSEQWKEYLTTQ